MRCTVARPTVDATRSLWCYCLTEDLWTLGGIITNVGNAYQWLGDNFVGVGARACDAYELLNRLAAEIEPVGRSGPLPALFCARFARPIGRSPQGRRLWKTRRQITTLATWRGRCSRASHSIRASSSPLARHESAVADRVMLTGGLARSPILPQLLADVLGEEVFAPDNAEGSIAGAAILGLKGLGGAIDCVDFVGARRAPVAPSPLRRRFGTATTAPTETTCVSSTRSGQSISDEGPPT